MQPRVLTSSDMTSDERIEFIRFVKLGAQVNPDSLPGLVQRAAALVVLHEGSKLIGTAAIKRPNKNHHQGDFLKAGVEKSAQDFPLEIGWVVVHPDHQKQGHSRTLVAAAIGATDGSALYATTQAPQMKHILPDYGFMALGTPFPSVQNAGGDLTLYVKAAEKAG